MYRNDLTGSTFSAIGHVRPPGGGLTMWSAAPTVPKEEHRLRISVPRRAEVL